MNVLDAIEFCRSFSSSLTNFSAVSNLFHVIGLGSSMCRNSFFRQITLLVHIWSFLESITGQSSRLYPAESVSYGHRKIYSPCSYNSFAFNVRVRIIEPKWKNLSADSLTFTAAHFSCSPNDRDAIAPFVVFWWARLFSWINRALNKKRRTRVRDTCKSARKELSLSCSEVTLSALCVQITDRGELLSESLVTLTARVDDFTLYLAALRSR